MISREEMAGIAEKYGRDVTVGTLGGHSALDVCRGAKDEGLRTVVVCKKGRERTYAEHYLSRDGKGVVDEVILVDDFSEITNDRVQERLRDLNTVFVHSRYFWVYCSFEEIENKFRVPIFGTRELVRKEERDEKKNQYFLLEEAGIRTPRRFSSPEDIDRLSIVKAPEAKRGYERAFFFASNHGDYMESAAKLLKAGSVTEEGLKSAVIEEFVAGAQINFNFFHSSLAGKVELLGTDVRRQTNLDGILRLPADQQRQVLLQESVKYIETGHIAVTVKESLIEKAYEAAHSFVKATQKHYPPGIIGPFALQGAIKAEEGKEELIVFDVSMRIPGSPGTRYTPYMNYLYGEDVSVGRRIAMEIRNAVERKELPSIVT